MILVLSLSCLTQIPRIQRRCAFIPGLGNFATTASPNLQMEPMHLTPLAMLYAVILSAVRTWKRAAARLRVGTRSGGPLTRYAPNQPVDCARPPRRLRFSEHRAVLPAGAPCLHPSAFGWPMLPFWTSFLGPIAVSRACALACRGTARAVFSTFPRQLPTARLSGVFVHQVEYCNHHCNHHGLVDHFPHPEFRGPSALCPNPGQQTAGRRLRGSAFREAAVRWARDMTSKHVIELGGPSTLAVYPAGGQRQSCWRKLR